MYEPEERAGEELRAHPVSARVRAFSMYRLCGRRDVALAYYKGLDDWNDDRSVQARAFAGMLADLPCHPRKEPSRGGRRNGHGRHRTIEAAAREAGAAQAAVPAPDAAASRSGLMGELFVYRPDDYWADDLRTVGARLGKFVYVMDAVMDYEDDRASGSYNPLVAMDMSAEDMREDLHLLAAGVAEAFERLPLERDLRLLRSVVYAGVWQKYYALENDKEKRRG
ncbi:MAG: DUF5685 family protein [Adlercreutzia equolifaciens]